MSKRVSPPPHYNPTPKFGLMTDDDREAIWFAGYSRYLDEEAERNGYCFDCGETFRYDDCGGYNPPCSCGLHCRDCHEAEIRDMYDYDDEDYSDDE